MFIRNHGGYGTLGMDNIFAGLEHKGRVSGVDIWILRSQTENVSAQVSATMQQPFLELRHLYLHAVVQAVPVIPTSFLGGSAPRLQRLLLDGFSFPGSPLLLLSATHLIYLDLSGIPDYGVLFTRGNRHLPLCDDKARNSHHRT